MGRLGKSVQKKDNLLTYEEIIKVVPELKKILTKEQELEFALKLNEITALLIELVNNEKEHNN
ncbi:hypothetical protein [Flavobacterium sp.]|jgi:hypothetical protein|uniref:hypothetical protein n=1 Tax=Flavobacterium sp. TaxID=239 RepID=UPI002638236A|nr:hypothetical protein [Flavobacterium sp.]